jgi:putative transposase
MKKQHVKLSETDRRYLEELMGKGQQSAKVYKRAIALLALDRGETYGRAAEMVGVTQSVVSTWAKNYHEKGLQCLHDKPRSGRPIEIDGLARAKITALACSEPPEGYGQWSLRLLADKAVELEYCEHISHNRVKEILKKTTSNPT